MKKILKKYGLKIDRQYYEKIIKSIQLGQKEEAIDQFNLMPRSNRKNFVILTNNGWITELNKSDINDFINNI